MKSTTNPLCKKLFAEQITVTIFAQTKDIDKKLDECLHQKNIKVRITHNNFKNTRRLQSSDIYIINSVDFTQKQKHRIIDKVITTNPQASIFLINDTEEEKSLINYKFLENKQVLGAADAVIAVLDCTEVDLQKIVDKISIVENTKVKIYELWNKLESVPI